MISLKAVILPVLLLTAFSYAQQNQQAAPPPTNQSSYPSETHKMTTAERSDTPSANGQPVDLNSASKKDLAALPGIGPDRAQSIVDARPFGSKEDLLKKKVIPQSTYEKIQDLTTANGPKKQSLPEGPETLRAWVRRVSVMPGPASLPAGPGI